MMSHTNALKNAIEFIESNIDKNINIHDVARSVHYSSYHFSRIFSKNIGITLGNYISIRKIGTASSQLLYSSRKLIDISSEAGYSSYEAFSREIKAKFGVSPYYFRSQKTLYYSMNRSLLDDEILNHLMNKLVITRRKVTLTDFKVIGYSVTTSLMDNQLALLWDEFNSSKKKLLGALAGSIESFSICESPQAILNKEGNSTFSQFLSFKKAECKIRYPKNYVTQSIKGGNYIIFEHRSTYHSLNLTYRYIWNIWFHSAPIRFDDTRKSFECYAADKNLILIYIPIK
jgi:AraC family transcriptional regulator